jgi:hypothetical protein
MAIERDERTLSQPRDERTLSQLFSDLTSESTALVRKEVELAKAEVSEKVNQVTTAGVALAAGGAILFAGLIILLLAAVFGLALLLEPTSPPALSALIVAIVTMIIGGIALMIGRNRLKAGNLAPTRTTDSLRRDRDLVKEHVR